MLASLTAFGRQNHQERPLHPNVLIVCKGAIDAKWTTSQGSDQLSYQVKVEYPANSILSCISKALKETGWRPLRDDYWNPGLPSSHVRGWTQFADATVPPTATVDQWVAQWEDKTGNIAWYVLRYRYPPGDRCTLTVYAGFVPADIAKKTPKNAKAQK